MREGWPSGMQRRIFELPIPGNALDVQYYETNNWKASRMYVQFRTSSAGLDRFLSRLGSGRAALKDGEVTIGARDTKIMRLVLRPRRRLGGHHAHQQGPASHPEHQCRHDRSGSPCRICRICGHPLTGG